MRFYIIISLFLILFLFACSSSSVTERYGRKKDSEIEKSDTTRRFTSANDISLYQCEFDEEPIEDDSINIKEFVTTNFTDSLTQRLSEKEKVMVEIIRYLNVPYKYGGNDSKGLDCSAFTQNVFSSSLNFKLPRTAREQFYSTTNIKNNDTLKFGDLVFFNTTKRSYPGHVGIFIGNNLFAHASFSKGVTISSLKNSYFKRKYIGSVRVIKISDN